MLNQGFTDLIGKEPQILYFDFVLRGRGVDTCTRGEGYKGSLSVSVTFAVNADINRTLR